ncbi:MAG TPA: hypothetical protein VLF40_03875 [Candidatus Saccharimonadales bacterium]|nr:hypothetical protein [Candidatus Saccharimonadales bacterium]
MAFELFQETGTRTKEFISVTETKAFGLSRAFLDKHQITSDYKAVIFYDAETNRIALHFSPNNPKIGFSVRISNEKHGATIIARSFFDLKNVDAKKFAGRYSDFEVVPLSALGQEREGDAYVITLKENEPQDSSTATTASRVEDIVIEDIGDEPINLDDIPF